MVSTMEDICTISDVYVTVKIELYVKANKLYKLDLNI